MVKIYKVPKVFTPTARLSFQKAKTMTLKTAQNNCYSPSLKRLLFSNKNTELTRYLSTNFK